MVETETFTQIALALPDTVAAPHFDRTAFKVKRIFATLAADGWTANLKFTVEEQVFKALVAPDIFQAIDNGWGRQGWTTLNLAAATVEDVAAALAMAHAHAAGPVRKR